MLLLLVDTGNSEALNDATNNFLWMEIDELVGCWRECRSKRVHNSTDKQSIQFTYKSQKNVVREQK